MYAIGSKVIGKELGRCTVRARSYGRVSYMLEDYLGRMWHGVPADDVKEYSEPTSYVSQGTSAVPVYHKPELVKA